MLNIVILTESVILTDTHMLYIFKIQNNNLQQYNIFDNFIDEFNAVQQ